MTPHQLQHVAWAMRTQASPPIDDADRAVITIAQVIDATATDDRTSLHAGVYALAEWLAGELDPKQPHPFRGPDADQPRDLCQLDGCGREPVDPLHDYPVTDEQGPST